MDAIRKRLQGHSIPHGMRMQNMKEVLGLWHRRIQKPRVAGRRLRNVASNFDARMNGPDRLAAAGTVTLSVHTIGLHCHMVMRWTLHLCPSPPILPVRGRRCDATLVLGLHCNSTGCLQHVAYAVYSAGRVSVKSFPCATLAVLDLWLSGCCTAVPLLSRGCCQCRSGSGGSTCRIDGI